MEISRIQPVENKRGIYSSGLIRRQNLPNVLQNTLNSDCFVKSSVTENILQNGNIPSGKPCFLGGIAYIRYDFENKFNRTFFKKLIREGVPDVYSDIEHLIPREELDTHIAMKTFSKKSRCAIKHLKKYRDSMFPIEKEIFTILENLSKKHPDLNLQELLRLRYANAEQILIHQQGEVLNKINLMIRQLPKNEFLSIRKLINGSFDKIFAQDPAPEERFGRKNFLKELKKIEMSDPKIKHKIYQIAEQLPQSSDSINAFIVKYSQPYRFRFDQYKQELIKLPRDSQEIGERLIEPSIGTDDHIHPQKEFKKEQKARLKGCKKAKYLSTLRVTTLTSRKANEAKTDTPIDKFIEQSEVNIPKRIQNQIDRYILICEKWLKQGKIEDADQLSDYIMVLKDEYTRRSKLINIDIAEFEKKLPQIKSAAIAHQEKLNAKKSRKHEGKTHIKRTNNASNSHKEQYLDSSGNLIENRKVQKHTSRFCR